MKYYKTHWGVLLITMSSLATLLCLGFAAFAFVQGGTLAWAGCLPLAAVIGCALFTVRGYIIEPDALLVRRLFWATRLPRAGLESARFEPDAMRWSIRYFGIGGLFSFSGRYWGKRLGAYRAFVTDRYRTVVLRYGGKTVVISPAEPEEFVREFSVPSRAA